MSDSNFMESASYDDSAIFTKLNATAQIKKRLANGLAKSVLVTPEMIVEYPRLEAGRVPLVTYALDEHKRGLIAIKYFNPSTPAESLPKMLPYVVTSNESGTHGIVLVAPFAKRINDDQLSIPVQQLSVLMVCASVSRQYYPRPEKFSSNMALVTWIADAYANIIVQLFKQDRNLEPGDEMNTALYIFSRFVVSAKTMLPVTSEDLQHTYAKKACRRMSNIGEENAKALWNSLPHDNIIVLLDAFIKENPKLQGLTASYMIQKWIHRFGDLSAMGIDQFPYFFMMIYSAQMHANLTKDSSVKNVINSVPGINRIESEIRRILMM